MVLDKLLSNLSVEVEPFALCHISRGWRLRLPEPPVPLLHFVLRGEGAIIGRTDQPQPLTASWFVVVPPGAKHALQASGQIEHERRIDPPPDGSPVCRLIGGSQTDTSFVVACGLVKVRYGPSLDLFYHLKDVLPADLSSVPLVSAAFNGILAEQAGLDPGSTTMTTALMTQCLVHFFRQVGSSGSLPWLDALDDPRLGRVIDRILEDPSADLTVESLAETASMSRSTFAERFAGAFGKSPMALVQHVRMQHAAHLLRQDGTSSIEQVAARSGYSSRSHFSAAFSQPSRCFAHRVSHRHVVKLSGGAECCAPSFSRPVEPMRSCFARLKAVSITSHFRPDKTPHFVRAFASVETVSETPPCDRRRLRAPTSFPPLGFPAPRVVRGGWGC